MKIEWKRNENRMEIYQNLMEIEWKSNGNRIEMEWK